MFLALSGLRDGLQRLAWSYERLICVFLFLGWSILPFLLLRGGALYSGFIGT